MELKMRKQAAVPPGNHTGIIQRCHVVEKSFDGGRTKEPKVEVVIQPDWTKPGYETVPVSCIYAHNLSSLSGLAGMLERIGVNLADGATFVPATIEGTAVAFESEKKDDGFVVVKKESIRRAPLAPSK